MGKHPVKYILQDKKADIVNHSRAINPIFLLEYY